MKVTGKFIAATVSLLMLRDSGRFFYCSKEEFECLFTVFKKK